MIHEHFYTLRTLRIGNEYSYVLLYRVDYFSNHRIFFYFNRYVNSMLSC